MKNNKRLISILLISTTLLVTPSLFADNPKEIKAVALQHFDLGVAYLLGQNVPQDDELAAGLFKKSANLGLADAQYNLSLIHI